MRYTILACDYDGTLATHGHIDKQTLHALEQVNASGRKLVLVSWEHNGWKIRRYFHKGI